MRGSLLIDFNAIDYRGGDSYQVFVNGNIVRDTHFTEIDNLYSTRLNVGDVCNISFNTTSNLIENIGVYRLDYTTDEENGDRGIKNTFVTYASGPDTGSTIQVTFTATTIPSAYDFYYKVDLYYEPCFDMGTGSTMGFTGGLYDGEVEDFELQSDGKIVAVGRYYNYSGVTKNGIVRLNTDGTIDNSFVVPTGLTPQPTVLDFVKIQSDGKILIYGDGTVLNSIYRLNTDGSIDTSFNLGQFDVLADIQTIELQSDGKILVGGFFSTFSGISVNDLIRLNSDGTLDNTFSIGTGIGPAQYIYDLHIYPDGKILVIGDFTSFSGVSANNIIRLNSDGSVDNTFVYGTGFDLSPSTLLGLSNDQVMVGGHFTSYNGTSINDLIILNYDGSLDSSFNINTSFGGTANGEIYALYEQPNGKFLVGGYFTTFSGQTYNRILRLNSDGSLDTTFDIGTGFSGATPDSLTRVNDIKMNDTGYIYVAGRFTSYKGVLTNNFIKISQSGTRALC